MPSYYSCDTSNLLTSPSPPPPGLFLSELVTHYSNVIDTYKPSRLDFDIEGAFLTNTAAHVIGFSFFFFSFFFNCSLASIYAMLSIIDVSKLDILRG